MARPCHPLWKAIVKVTALLDRSILATVLLSVSVGAIADGDHGIERGLVDPNSLASAAANVHDAATLAREKAPSLSMKASTRSALASEATLPALR